MDSFYFIFQLFSDYPVNGTFIWKKLLHGWNIPDKLLRGVMC